MSALTHRSTDFSYSTTTESTGRSLHLETGKAKYRWNRDNYSDLRRRLDIWYVVLTFVLQLRWDAQKWAYPGGYSDQKREQRQQRQAVWIRENMLELGPTFIKLGQLFSTRGDIFPMAYVSELSKLQDRVPAFDYTKVVEIIERDLGKPLNILFASFDPTPLAAASLGQVHRAQLHSGEEVVVKIQRPGLKELFTIDLGILKRIAQYFQNHPRWGKNRDWLGIYEECCRILWEETDYLNEGRNADTFRRNFRDVDWVQVPKVYWRYSSPRVLTLEYLPGIKISHYEALEAAGLDRKRLAEQGAEAYLHQLLGKGFFHADPHPGNIAAAPDGSLIFYDFGMMGRVDGAMRDKLMDTLYGIAEQNADRVIDALIELKAIQPVGDMGPVRRSIQYMLDNFMDKPFEEQSISAISDDLYDIAYDQPFRFPATFTFVMRAFSTLEGVGKGLDPEFNFMEVAKPFAMEMMSNSTPTDPGSLLDELGRQAAQVSTSALGLPRRIEDTIEKLERGDVRVRVRSSESDRILRRLGMAQMLTNYVVLFGTFTLSATILFVYSKIWVAVVMSGVAIAAAVAGFRVMQRMGRYDRLP
ncbi:MAG: AarF/ABC1/UbiB kinase family protein [Spirulina sp. SIO3F2]|nr:AarF/ABC1/UbiB kinase family protein [Spirulina sp. SIO3F2]